VNKTELEEFLRGVDELRETADRIEARLGRLEARLEGAT
jgi:ubiquinone biosynthesis protein UbiJ